SEEDTSPTRERGIAGGSIMERRDERGCRRRWWRWGSLLPGLLAGCCTDRWVSRPCETIPQGAIPQPLGVKGHRLQERPASEAEDDDFVIYKHEWYKGGRALGPYGTYHLGEIIKRLPVTPFPVLLEVATDDPELNEARRALVVSRLTLAGIPNA